MQRDAAAYVLEAAFTHIQGSVGAENLEHLYLFAGFQEQAGIVGDLAEIGVFKGRLLALLHLLSRPDEQVLAIDVFGDLQHNFDVTGGATSSAEVLDNLRTVVDPGAMQRLHLVAGDSLYLLPEDLRRHMTHPGFRIFSIDGAHSWYHTANDLRIADRLIAPGGIVLLDDMTNAGWPGVMEGAAKYLMSQSDRRLFPFMMGHNKLWLTTWDHHTGYLDLAWESAKIFPGQLKRKSEFFGNTLVGF